MCSSDLHPATILRRLKASPDIYARPRTVGDLLRDAARDGLGAALADRAEWGAMRMSPNDLSDVSGYRFLVNGKGPGDNWTALFAPGERVQVICKVGGRSARATAFLRDQGVDAVNVIGGMLAWAAAGLDVVTDDGSTGHVA